MTSMKLGSTIVNLLRGIGVPIIVILIVPITAFAQPTAGGMDTPTAAPAKEKASTEDEPAEAASMESADGDESMSGMKEEGGHHAMAHPFFGHMGLPDGPGEANIRLTPIFRKGHSGSGTDFGLHVEGGLVPGLGFHIRNDGAFGTKIAPEEPPGPMEEGAEKPVTEFMLMKSLITSDDGTRGVSIFGQLAWPVLRGDDPVDDIEAAIGFGARYMYASRYVIDATLHVPTTKDELELEYETTLMMRAVGQLFLVLEDRGSVTSESISSYLTPAVKYRVGKISFGAGAQFPITSEKDFDVQGILQLDVGFM